MQFPKLGYDCRITDSADELSDSSKIIIPGVGGADSAMKWIREKADKLYLS